MIDVPLREGGVDCNIKGGERGFVRAVEVGAFGWFADAWVVSIYVYSRKRRTYHRSSRFSDSGQVVILSLEG